MQHWDVISWVLAGVGTLIAGTFGLTVKISFQVGQWATEVRQLKERVDRLERLEDAHALAAHVGD